MLRTAIPTTSALLPLLLVLVIGLPACVHVDPRPDFERARDLVSERTGRSEVFDPSDPAQSMLDVDALLADGLSRDEALRLALVNSHELRAEFQEIGIAHADWVQSGMLSNPSLDVLLRFPSGGGRSGLEGALTGDLLAIWHLPLREQIARHELDATVLRVARQAAERLSAAQDAYDTAVAAAELAAVAEQNLALVSRSAQAVSDLREAGSADELDFVRSRAPVLEAQVALDRANFAAREALRELARALSIERDVSDLALLDPLPDPLGTDAEAPALVETALASRLDLQALARAVDAADARLALEHRRVWGDLFGGVSAERPAEDGATLVGPALSWTLPLFDQNQAQIARAEFELERLRRELEQARVDVAQEVRSAADRARTAAAAALRYRDEVVPSTLRAFDLAQTSYESGRATLSTLIDVQMQVLDSRRTHVEARLDAATAATELIRAVGRARSTGSTQ